MYFNMQQCKLPIGSLCIIIKIEAKAEIVAFAKNDVRSPSQACAIFTPPHSVCESRSHKIEEPRNSLIQVLFMLPSSSENQRQEMDHFQKKLKPEVKVESKHQQPEQHQRRQQQQQQQQQQEQHQHQRSVDASHENQKHFKNIFVQMR